MGSIVKYDRRNIQLMTRKPILINREETGFTNNIKIPWKYTIMKTVQNAFVKYEYRRLDFIGDETPQD